MITACDSKIMWLDIKLAMVYFALDLKFGSYCFLGTPFVILLEIRDSWFFVTWVKGNRRGLILVLV